MGTMECRDVGRIDARQAFRGSEMRAAVRAGAVERTGELIVSERVWMSASTLELGNALLSHEGDRALRELRMTGHVDEQFGTGGEVAGKQLEVEKRSIPIGTGNQVGT